MSATEITSEIWQNRRKEKHGRATEGEEGSLHTVEKQEDLEDEHQCVTGATHKRC